MGHHRNKSLMPSSEEEGNDSESKLKSQSIIDTTITDNKDNQEPSAIIRDDNLQTNAERSNTIVNTDSDEIPIMNENLDENTEPQKQNDVVISVEDVKDKIEFSSLKPYKLINISQTDLFNFDPERKITYIEAWELNLYVGTNLGEIIHLYKIDDTSGYIQISKQKFSSNSTKPIKKIVVLPEVSIALIHCGNTVSGYLLPELSPANIGKAKDVTDISIDWIDLKIDDTKRNRVTKKEDYYGDFFVKVTIFTKKSIKLLRIFSDSMRLHKELQYADIISGLQMSNFSIVSNSTNYDLVDISQSQKIFLFPISTTESADANLNPIIKYVKKNELLLICGGSNDSDPAVGMFINTNGDVIRGTLNFESYPTSVEVDYPYVLAVLENKMVNVYSIFDQNKLQEILFDFDNINIQLHESSRIFEIKDSELTKKITIAPIISTMDNDEIQRIAIESDNAVKKAVCLSSCIIYDEKGHNLKIMKPLSKYDRWLDIYNSCQKIDCSAIYEKLFQELQESHFNKFLMALLGLFTLEYEMYDQTFELWTTNFKYMDPRLMIYIFSDGSDSIYGSVWTYQALFSKVEELKKMEKPNEMKDFFKLYLNTCLTINFKDNTIPIGKSIEVALVRIGIFNKEDIEPVIHEIKYSSNEVIEILLLNKKYFLLSKFYSKLKDHRQLLYYWKGLIDGELEDVEFDKNFNDINKSLQFLVNYILTNCVNDEVVIERYSEWLLNKYPKFGLKLITDNRIKQLEINDIKILNMLNDFDKKENSNPNLKLAYLEYIFENKNEKQFLGDIVLIYLEIIITTYENDPKLKSVIDNAMKEYLLMDNSKPSIYKYWKIIKDTEINSKDFIRYHDNLYNYLNMLSLEMKSVLDQTLVLKKSKERIVGTKYSSVFPLISIMILYKFQNYAGVVDELIKIKDYTTAENFAISLTLEFIELDSKIKSIKMQNKTKLNNSSVLINDEVLSTSNVEHKQTTDELLKKIFDIYLQSNETKLIDNFLSKYDLLSEISDSPLSTLDRMDRFVEVLNKVPESFPLDKLKRFMATNLIEFKDYNDQVHIKKTLIKVEVNQLDKLNQKLSKISHDI